MGSPGLIACFCAVLLAVGSACNGGDGNSGREHRPVRRSYYISSLRPDVREGMPVSEAVDRLVGMGFECKLWELPRVTCCSEVRILERTHVCNRPDGPSLAQVTFVDRGGRVGEISSGGSLTIVGPSSRRDRPVEMPASPPDP